MRGMIQAFALSTWIALIFLFVIAAGSLIIPALPASDPYAQDLGFRNQLAMSIDSTGKVHVLGTDQLGRDLLSRVALAGRISLAIALTAVITSMVVGTALGL